MMSSLSLRVYWSVSRHCLFILVLLPSIAIGQTHWVGLPRTSWFTASNWEPATVPDKNASVIIVIGVPIVASQAAQAQAVVVGVSDGLTSEIDILSGGSLVTGTVLIGPRAGDVGAALVDDASLILSDTVVSGASANIFVGKGGSGSLTAQNKGLVLVDRGLYVHSQAGTASSVLITGLGSKCECSIAIIGSSSPDGESGGYGACSFTVDASAAAEIRNLLKVDGIGGTPARLTVTGQGTLKLITPSGFIIGGKGQGILLLKDLGTVDVANGTGTITLAQEVGSTGTLFIGDPANNTFSPGTLKAGKIVFGQGMGVISAHIKGAFNLASEIEGPGSITQSGTGTLVLTKSIAPTVGIGAAAGSIQIGNGVENGYYPGVITTESGSGVIFNPVGNQTSAITVNGGGAVSKIGRGTFFLTAPQDYTGPTFVLDGKLGVVPPPPGALRRLSPSANGPAAVGELRSTVSVTVDNSAAAEPPAVLEVSGAATQVTATQGTSAIGVTIGNSGRGALDILNGGSLSNQIAQVGIFPASVGTVLVDASTWTSTDDLTIGRGGTGTATVQNGGAIVAKNVILGDTSSGTGTLTVTGPGSIYTTTSIKLTVGNNGSGALNVMAGGVVTGGGLVAGGSGGRGEVSVVGAGSIWSASQVSIGPANGSRGMVTVAEGGILNQPGQTVRLGRNAGGNGTLVIGRGDAAGSVNAAGVQFGGSSAGTSGAGTLRFNHLGTATFNLPITGFGGNIVKDGAGTTILNGPILTFTGGIMVNAGVLEVSGTLPNVTSLTVNAGAMLNGNGSLGRSNAVIDIAASGMLAVVPGKTLTIDGVMTNTGSMRLSPGAALVFGPTTLLVNNGVIDLRLGGTFTPPANFVNNGVILAPSDAIISSVTKIGETVTIIASCHAGHTYQLQRSDGLTSGVFKKLGTPQSPGADGTLTFTDANANGPAGYYRVVVDP